MKKRVNLIFVAILALVLAACGNDSKKDSSANASAQDQTIQYFGGSGSVTIFELAGSLGYFDTIKLENVGTSKGGPSDIQLVSSGDIDVGNAFTGAIIKAVGQGVKVKGAISSYGSDDKYNQKFYVRDDSGINEAKDLIGKKVGVNTLGAHGDFLISEYLRKSGLTEKEIEKVELVTIPWANGEQGLRNKQIDAVYFDTELAIVAEKRGGVKELFQDIDLFGEYAGGTYVFSEKYMKENPETMKEFVSGSAKAFEWTKEHTKEEVIAQYKEILKERGLGETEAYVEAYTSTGVTAPGGILQDKDWTIWLDWLEKNSDFNVKKLNLKDAYTNEFNSYAE